MTCMYPPPFRIKWFRSTHPIISVTNRNTSKLVVYAMRSLQGVNPEVNLSNDRLHDVLDALGIKMHITL